MIKILHNNDIKIIATNTFSLDVVIDNYTFIDGDKLYFTIKRKIEDENFILQKVITSYTDNKAHIDFSATDTNALMGEYVYDVKVALSNGTIDTIIVPSKFIVLRGVTDEW